MTELELTDETFEKEVLKSKEPVLVDFFADWCGPCQMLAPIIEELAKEYEGKWKVAKVNIDKCPKTTGDYGVQSIPTLVFFKDGEVIEKMMGFQSKEAIVAKMI